MMCRGAGYSTVNILYDKQTFKVPEDEFADYEARSTPQKRKFPEIQQSRPDGAASRPALVKGPPKGKGKGKNKGAKSSGKAKDAKTKKEICWAFNEGQCTGRVCPNGRDHVCWHCGKYHLTEDCE